LAPTSAEPGLWGHLAVGSHLDSATVHVRKVVNAVQTEYLTYTLTNVTINSFSTSEAGSEAPLDTIQLAYDSVSESYSRTNANGTLGAANTAQYDLVRGTSNGTGSLLPDPI